MADGAVESNHLSKWSVSSEHIQEGSVFGYHLVDDSVQSRHLANGSITSNHLSPNSVGSEHLRINPVQAISGQEALQQFGMSAFLLNGYEKSTEITIHFDEPFDHAHYVIVAMTNHPAYYVSLKDRSPDMATVEVSRMKDSPINYGFITWIAIASKDESTIQ